MRLPLLRVIILPLLYGGETPPTNGGETPPTNGGETPTDTPVCDDPAVTDTALPGAGTTDDPFVLCRPAHMSLIGTTPTYALDKHYILGKDIDLAGSGQEPHRR